MRLTADFTKKISAIFIGLFCAAIWSAHSSVSSLALKQNATHFDLALLRVIGASLLFLPWLYKTKFQSLVKIPPSKGLFLCTCVGVPFVLINTFGLYFAPVTHSGILSLGLINLFSSLMGVFILGESLSLSILLRLMIIIFGLLIFALNVFDANLGNHFWIGDLCFLLAGILWAAYAVYGKKWGHRSQDYVAVACFYSLAYIPIYFIFVDYGLFNLSWEMILFQLFYQGVLTGALTLYFFLKLTDWLGIVKGTVFTAIPPLGTAIAGKLILGHASLWNEWLGLFLVSLGIYLVLTHRKKNIT